MKTHKLRFGFACNSSSVSSLILVKPNTDHKADKIWTKIEDKRTFFANIMYAQEGCDKDKLDFINKLCETNLTDDNYDYCIKNYISTERGAWDTFFFPRDKTGKLNEEFAKEFLAYSDKYDISWVSNEDNCCDDAYEIASSHSMLGLNLLRYFPAGIARKDKDYWTIFSPENGYKVRLSFDFNSVAPEKSTIPELIDIKLTDYCPYECTFCYQGSTKEGRHVDTESFKEIINQLHEYGVFEIALGGGEPTLHPHFDELINYINEKNIVVNITTRNTTWIKKYIDELFEGFSNFGYKPKIKAVAISTEDTEIIDQIDTYINKVSRKERRRYVSIDEIKKHIQFQYIVGINEKLESILLKCIFDQYRVTLLGYKTTNRGSLLKPKKEEWMKVVQKLGWGRSCVGIDTVLAKECKDIMSEEFDELLLEKHEGRFSCYIDAVNYKIGPSSFCAAEDMMPFTDLKENFKAITDKS
jgi:organic radical activating enzyme